MKAFRNARYWALLFGIGLGIAVLMMVWQQYQDVFREFFGAGVEAGSFVMHWLLRGLLIVLAIWGVETIIADGVAKGIAKAKAAEIKQAEKERAKAATP